MSCLSPIPQWNNFRYINNKDIQLVKVFDYHRAAWWLARGGYNGDVGDYERRMAISSLLRCGEFRPDVDPWLFTESQSDDQRFWRLYDDYFGYYRCVGGVYKRYDVRKHMTYDDLRYLSDGLESRYRYARPDMQLPCNVCIGCARDRSKEWAIRCEHEMTCHDSNCFITLTYDDDHIPDNGNLIYGDFQRFMKRLRVYLDRNPDYSDSIIGYDGQISYFVAGEYGHESFLGRPFGRPHFHAILFGVDFPDKYKWSISKRGNWQCRSDVLEQLWPYGFSTIGEDCNYGTAMYTAKYITKDLFVEQYKGQLERTFMVNKPMIHVSSRAAIGAEWLLKYSGDFLKDLTKSVIECDNIDTTMLTSRGIRHRLPRYYKRYHPQSELLQFIQSQQHHRYVSPYDLRVKYENVMSYLC